MVCAGEFKVFPGATIDKEATEKAQKMAPGTKSTIYTTEASFEKVNDFYARLGKKIEFPMKSGHKLPSGEELKMSFYVFDGAPSLDKSKLWIKIQRPYIEDMQSQKVRDVTVIVLVDQT
jgi:hypothetical protein